MQDSQRISELRRLLASDSITDPALRQRAQETVDRADRRRSGNELANESGFYRADDGQLHLTMRAAPEGEEANRAASTGVGLLRTLARGGTDALRGLVELPDDVMGRGRGEAERRADMVAGADRLLENPDLSDDDRAWLEHHQGLDRRRQQRAEEADVGLFRRIGNNIPQVDVGNNWERAGAYAAQYIAPAIGTRGMLDDVARGGRNLARRLGARGDGALSRVARGTAGELAVAPAVLATEAAVTDPDQAETLGDVIGGPTRIREDDDRLTRRGRVGLEGAGLNAAARPIVETATGAARQGWSILSGRPAIEDTIRRALGDGLSQEQLETAVRHLRELEGANQTLARTGDISSVNPRLRPFVTPPGGEAPVTMDAYLAEMMGTDARGVSNAVHAAANESDRLSARLAHQSDSRTEGVSGAIQDLRPDEGMVDGRQLAANQQQQMMADQAENLIAGSQEAQRGLRETVEQQRQAGGRVRDILFDNIDPRDSIALPRRQFNEATRSLLEEGQEALRTSELGRRALQLIQSAGSQTRLTYGGMNRLRKNLNQLLRSGDPQRDGEAMRLVRQFNGLFGRYTEHLAGQRHPAANVARAAMDFFRDDYVPRFRQHGGQRYADRARGRADVTSDEQVANLFLNNSATGMEDASTLARILRGYDINEETVANILRNNGANPEEVLGNISLSTPGQAGRGAVQVNQIMQGRYVDFLNGRTPTAGLANQFLRRNRKILDEFPEVADAVRSYGDNFQSATVQEFAERGGPMGRSPVEVVGSVMGRNADARMSQLVDDAMRSADPQQSMADLRAATSEWLHTAVVRGGGDTTARNLRKMLSDPNRRRALSNVFGEEQIEAMNTIVRQFAAVDSARMARNSTAAIKSRDPGDIFREIMVDISGANQGLSGRARTRSMGNLMSRLINRIRRALPGDEFDALQDRMLDEMASNPSVMRQYLEPQTAVKMMERHYRDVIAVRGGARALMGFRENEETE